MNEWMDEWMMITAHEAAVIAVQTPGEQTPVDRWTAHQNVLLYACIHSLTPDSWLLLHTVICQALVLFILCILCHLSLLPPLSRASNNNVPLGVDKCGCCDKKLGEGKMQSVSISSHCQYKSAATGGNQHLIYWCAPLRAASADYGRWNLETVMVSHLLPSFRMRGDWFVGRVTTKVKGLNTMCVSFPALSW